jgi:hypothetical protein
LAVAVAVLMGVRVLQVRAAEVVEEFIVLQLPELLILVVAVVAFGVMNCRAMYPVPLALAVLVLYIFGIMFFDLTFI